MTGPSQGNPAPAGDLVLQRVNTAIFPDPGAETAHFLAVYQHLQGALMPEPVATPEGKWLVRERSGWWPAWLRVPGAAPLGALGDSPGPVAAPAGSPSRVGSLWSFVGA